MNDARFGYSDEIVRRVRALAPDLPIRRFAEYCLANEIPVSLVAKRFKVSRETVYNWFTGVHTPRSKRLAEMMAILENAGV